MAKTAVIGGGPMGLACAYQLAIDGHQVTLYEADDRLGGMSAHFDFNGLSIERYYHFICKEDHDLFALLKELNLESKLKWHETRMGYFYAGQLYEWGNPFALLKFPKLSLLSKIRYGVHMFLSTKRKNWQALEGIDAVSWLKKAEGEKTYNVLWKKLFAQKFYDYTPNLSAPWIWARIRRVGRSRKSIFKEQMGYLEGGSETLLNALRNKLEEKGVTIHLNSAVEKVAHKEGKVQGLLLNGEFNPYDKVYSTVPLPFVTRIIDNLPEEHQRKYASINNIGCVCLIFKLKKAVTENFWLNVNDDAMEIPGIIEYSNLNNQNNHIVYVPFYMPQTHPKFSRDDQAFIDESKAYLFKINPALTEDDIVDVNVSRYGFAQPICPPNFMDDLPPIKSAIEGLYIADTSYYYPEDRSITESVGLGRKIAQL